MAISTLLIVGIIGVLGFLGARFSDRIHIPWVVGYILVGVVLGASGFHLISEGVVEALNIVSLFALALIGFTIGGELQLRDLRELGKSITVITLFEASSAFLLVLATVYLVTRNLPLAIVFGALASATAPAATVDVLWQYRSRGPLTTTLFGVVGLDDAAALIIYAFASSITKAMLGSEGLQWAPAIGRPIAEIGGSILLGMIGGLALHYALRWVRDSGQRLIILLGMIVLCAGLADRYNLSLILTSMAMGFTLVNLSRENRSAFELTGAFNPPVMVLFFVLVGARVNVALLPSIGLLGITYLVMRVVGKTAGAWTGARVSNAPEVVKRYLGLGLLSQAGVAIGLAIDASHTFVAYGDAGAEIGLLAVNVIAATTFVYQVIGPAMTKVAIFKAGEVAEEFLPASQKSSRSDTAPTESTP
ncbi:MAG: cation:proton antiporter [Coriobacteriia bacterium]|nr:cation:proton antiporter [Coriobacteriia bacterium]